jgi:hypothetical protein
VNKELQKLAHQVAMGALDALPDLLRLAVREGQLPSAGPPQIMIRCKRNGKFWTGGTRARGQEWDRTRAQTYQSMGSAKRSAGHIRANQQCKWVTSERFETFKDQVVVNTVKGRIRRDELGMDVWYYERIEIVEVVPLELRITPVEEKKNP